MPAKNIIELGFDINKFDADKKHVYDGLMENYELIKRIENTKISVGDAGGWTELKTKIAELKQQTKELQDANVKMAQSLANTEKQMNKSAKAEKDLADAKLKTAKASESQAKADKLRSDTLIKNEKELDRQIKKEEELNAAKSKQYNPASVPFTHNLNADGTVKENNAKADSVLRLSDEELMLQRVQASGLPIQTTLTNKKKEEIIVNKEIVIAKEKLLQANSKENVDLQGLNIQRTLSNKAAKEEAMNTLGLLGPYQQLSLRYEKAAQSARDLSVQYGVGSVQAKAASREALLLDSQLKAIDLTTGRANKSVGDYTNSIKKAYSGIRVLANILPGIGISGLFLLGFEGIEKIAHSVFEFGNIVSVTIQKKRDLDKAFADSESVYTAAVTLVNKLTNEIKLAKEGFLNKKEVLNEYNNTLGKTTGQVKNLDEAELALVKNGDAYIKMMLYKAAANIALEGAAKKAFEAEQIRRKDVEEFNQRSFSNLSTVPDAPSDLQEDIEKKEKENAAKRKQRAIKRADDEKNLQLDIAKKFQEDAAKISKEFKFDFFNDEHNSNDPKQKKDNTAEESYKRTLEYLKKIKEEYAKYSTDQLKSLQDQYKQESADQDKSVQQRLEAAQNYYDVSLQLTEKEKQNKLSIIQDETNIELERSKSSKERAAILTLQAVKERSIISEANRTFLKEGLDFTTESTKILKEGFSKDEKEIEEHVAFLKKKNEERLKQATDRVDINTNTEATKALEEFNFNYKKANAKKREKLEEDLQRKLSEIEKKGQLQRLAIEEENLEIMKGFMELVGLDTTDIEKQITENLKAQAEARKGISKDEADSRKKDEEEVAAAKKQLANETISFVQALVDGGYERQKNAIQLLIDKNNEYSAAETERINNSTMSETDKAAKLIQLQATTSAKNKQFAQQQKEQDIKKAKFDKAVTIAKIIEETAVAVIKTLPEGLITGLTYIVGAIGAIQLASAIATPVPTYADGIGIEGKGQHPGGKAIVGEGKLKELVEPKGGKAFIADRPMLINNLPAGSKVTPLTDDRVNEAMYSSMMSGTAERLMERQHISNEAWAIARWQVDQLKEKKQKKVTIVNKMDIGFASYINGRIFRTKD